MAEGLKIKIGADVAQGVAGINQFNRAVSQIKPGAGQATNAMINLSRVVQDAPFGFIGIANNINPLLESFQRLQGETKSLGGTLKALGASLIGAGGIGLALSAVQFLMLGGFGAFNSYGKGAKQAAEEVKSAGDIIKEATGSVSGQIVEVRALAEAVKDETKTHRERLEALKQLKKINKEYFGDLTLETSQYGKLNTAVDGYVKSLIQQAIIKDLQSEIGKVGAEFTKQRLEILRAQKALQDYQQQFKAQREEDFKKGIRTFIIDPKLDELSAALRKAQKEAEPLGDQFSELEAAINSAIGKNLKFAETGEKAAKQVKDEVENLRHALIITNDEWEKLKAIAEARSLRKDSTGFDTGILTITPKVVLPTSTLTEAQAIARQIADVFNNAFNKAIEQIGEEAVGTLGEIIGTALAGGNAGDVLKSFVGVFADQLITLGKIAIQTGLAMKGLKEALKTLNPGAAIAVGVGLIAIGAAVKTSISKIPKFAEGGLVTGKTLAVVGDNPSGKEAIIPFEKMGQFLNQFGGGGGEKPMWRFSRDEMILWLEGGYRKQARFG